MGLFDTVICEYSLPLPEFTKEEMDDINAGFEEGSVDWTAIEWQTKDLDNALDVYTLEEDGQIYMRKIEWIEDDDEKNPTGVKSKEGELVKYERTGEISFYNIVLGEKYDHWLEFKTVVWKGDIKELTLVEYKKEDNSDRLEYMDRMKSSLTEYDRGRTRFGFLYKIYRLCLVKPLGALRYILGLIANLTWKIERWMP